MLDWFGRKIKETQEVKRDERGFTLIELLVVVIIIGILAAIAIPVFLNQRENAQEATVKSDVRNAVTMDTAGQTDNGTGIANGSYTSGAQIGTPPNSFRVSEGVTITVTADSIQGAYAAGGPTGTWTYTKTGTNAGRYTGTQDFAP